MAALLKKFLGKKQPVNKNHEEIKRKIKDSEELTTIFFFLSTMGQMSFDLGELSHQEIKELFEKQYQNLFKYVGQPQTESLSPIRQFFKRHRKSEKTFVISSFDEMKDLIWEFIQQVSRDIKEERDDGQKMDDGASELKKAIKDNSVEELKRQAQEFLSIYKQVSAKRKARQDSKIEALSSRLKAVHAELVKTKEEAQKDPLTGAFNRKAFDSRLKLQTHLTHLSGDPSTLLIIDIDHFKKINDNYGHQAGDFILKELTARLFKFFPRRTDTIARYGGEEFAVILAATNEKEAEKITDRFLKSIREGEYEFEGKVIKITASIGIAEFDGNETISSWIKRADKVLYEAKHNGRDQARVASLENKRDDVA